ncbi:uncharacterized protein J4E78_010889 [Alternaria triticimaculans]|uniref:uncharacterized protein n=1 Tax=Alternaria triticimaculans TaxID=297637 RepID=UPI0020C44475|nr:uncharacterized protein J4E78_010889 [Alternaria triticimaculans]KAI4639562.1 hypothetical protein J4E78_010889 [Alternaria triticimaculans]
MAYDSHGFLAKCMNEYGDGSPFFLDGAGERLLFILDPEHIKGALNNSAELDPNPFIHDKIMGALMSSPKAAIDYYNSPESNTDYIQTAHIRQHTTSSNLGLLVQRLFDVMKRTISETLASTPDGTWHDIPDLYAFLEYHLSYGITETLLGSSIIESYPEIVTDLWIHIEATDQFFMGLPRFVIPKAYAARDRLLSAIRTWTIKSEALRQANAVNTVWDPVAGSGLLQEREKLYSEMPGHGIEGRSAQTLGLLYGGTSLTVPVTFWYLFETLRNPDLQQRVLSEMQSHVHEKTKAYNFMQLTSRPLFQSLHAETTRMYSSNLAVREVTSETWKLDGKYTVPKGTQVFISHKFAGQFTKGWKSIRPQTVAKPLDTFWPERYLVNTSTSPSTSTPTSTPTPSNKTDNRSKFSDAGLSGSWTSFGGGEHKCPGRHFARNIGIVTLAVLMGVFEIEVNDLEGARRLDPGNKRKAFGTMRPRERIAGRVRRRV